MSLATEPAKSHPEIDVIQEVRLAVVMYGGVSLAIYINGVAQELLSLVRSTATDASPPKRADGAAPPPRALIADEDLRGAEPVYREIARRLSAPYTVASPDGSRSADATIRVGFAVDILSGTSAGGINAIFLAKAMANGTDMEKLKELWVSQGDLDLLLNDGRSTVDMPRGYRLNPKPTSLLNSQRMLVQLRKALDGMDPPDPDSARAIGDAKAWRPLPESTPPPRSPLARAVTLYITATDLAGVVKPIQLWDKRVYERAYRGVFRFVYDNDGISQDWRHDFRPVDNPFLAFAARCTSSFPVAFEPMMLDDILEVSPAGQHARLRDDMIEWRRFFGRYLPKPDERASQRSFGDGGYLDNKPFGHAIDELQYRRAETLVDRKLIYVEPAPENPELEGEVLQRPNAIENLALAAFTLPRAETIREDLERIRSRNELIERISRATRNIDQDVAEVPRDSREIPGDDWAHLWLHDQIEKYGPSCGPYHRLKVAALTTDLAEMITRVAGHDPDSQECDAIRLLVSAWRQERYDTKPRANAPGILSENRLLIDFDLGYRLRRIGFLRSRIDMLLAGQSVARDLIRTIVGDAGLPDDACASFRAAVLPAIRDLRETLGRVHSNLRVTARRLRSPIDSPLCGPLEKLEISGDQLVSLLRHPDPKRRAVAAADLLQAHRGPLEATVDKLCGVLKEQFENASRTCRSALDAPDPNHPERARVTAYLARCYNTYDYYDIVLFPMQYGTEFGEGQPVQPVRVSPEDATTLIREFDDAGQRRLSKLAGTSVGNFGGFLDETWRKSDILWGRLDGADRLIHALLSTSSVSPLEIEDLVVRAQAGIVEQTLANLGDDEARDMLVECVIRAKTREDGRRELCRMLDRLTPHYRGSARVLDRQAILDRFADRYENHRSLRPEHALRLIARASSVFGRVLDGLSDRYRWIRRTVPQHLVWGGQVLWGFVEVAVPGGFFRIAADWWWKLAYALTAMMALVGSVLAETEVRNVGLLLLATVLVLDVARRLLGTLMVLGEGWLRRVLTLLGVMALLLLGAGVGIVIDRRLSGADVGGVWPNRVRPFLDRLVNQPWSLLAGVVVGIIVVEAVNRFIAWRTYRRRARTG
jgi:patatin-related protein